MGQNQYLDEVITENFPEWMRHPSKKENKPTRRQCRNTVTKGNNKREGEVTITF